MIVAIDGPSGAGKSTVAERVALQFHLQLIDTGALYRTLTLFALNEGYDLTIGAPIAALAANLNFEFRWVDDHNVLYCDGTVIGDDIRTQRVSEMTSRVASLPEVREVLLGIQRQLGNAKSSVLEGRDIGTVVFPNAEVKIFLAASADERARRRVAQANARGENIQFADVLAQIKARDARDSERNIAPLRCPDDAIRIDSTSMTLDEVTGVVAAAIEKHL